MLMENERQILLLTQAQEEIYSLRRRNEILEAKVEVMNLFGLVFRTTPNYPLQGASVDVTRELENLKKALWAKEIKKEGE